MKVHLLLIDPQKDFCHPDGALSVPGGDKDCERVAMMIQNHGHKIDDIHVTLDQHHKFDVAHPLYYINSDGNHPQPFTIITSSDLENGVWQTTVPSLMGRTVEYLKALETSGRYPLCVWPEHCKIGSEGAMIMPDVFEALDNWCKTPACIDFVSKGSNIFTEHYSALKAEVPDPEDPSTQINTKLIETLENADAILVAGQASSHCVANSAYDIADAFSSSDFVSKMVFLTDASSPVPGFDQFETDFLKELTAKGMKTATTDTFFK